MTPRQKAVANAGARAAGRLRFDAFAAGEDLRLAAARGAGAAAAAELHAERDPAAARAVRSAQASPARWARLQADAADAARRIAGA